MGGGDRCTSPTHPSGRERHPTNRGTAEIVSSLPLRTRCNPWTALDVAIRNMLETRVHSRGPRVLYCKIRIGRTHPRDLWEESTKHNINLYWLEVGRSPMSARTNVPNVCLRFEPAPEPSIPRSPPRSCDRSARASQTLGAGSILRRRDQRGGSTTRTSIYCIYSHSCFVV